MRKGFTLVELAIVLVIIGLIIGGILVAQSMIGTSKIAATLQQIGQFDAGVENFKTKYGYLPGDAAPFGGDQDGLIEMSAASGLDNETTVFGCEIANFWNNIEPKTFQSSACTTTGTQIISTGTGKNVPISKMGKPNSVFIASAISPDAYHAVPTDVRNFYAILDLTQAQALSPYSAYQFTSTSDTNSAVTSADAAALDQKMDDAIANSGNVISGSIGHALGLGLGGIIASPVSSPGVICSSGAAYLVQDPGFECTPLIRIGNQTGDLQ